MKFLFNFFLFTVIPGLLFCCTTRKDLDENGVPQKLIAAVTPGEDPEQTMKKMEPVKLYLQKKLGVEVLFIKATDYTAVIEAVRAKKVHVAFMSPFSYVLASERAAITPLVSFGSKGSPRMYRSIIFTHKNSGIKSMKDVKKRAKQLTLTFSDPASTSGHLVPRAYLISIGLDPKNAFKETLFASSHVASMMTVKSGKADIGCSYTDMYDRILYQGLLKKDDLNILWTSDPIVSGPVVIRSDINKEFTEKVKQALLDLPSQDPNAWTIYKSASFAHDTTFVFVETRDSLFNGLRKIAAGIKDLKMQEH